jgi:Family of unknown function (DUF6498)
MTEAARDLPAGGGLPRLASTGITLVGNLIPLVGVLFWQWDTFQLLMLYWMETVILAFWTLRRLARLPPEDTGNITINGREQPASNAMLVGFFALHAGMFILVHLIFLWAIFSGEWLKKVHGPASFFGELFLANGLWIALVFFLLSGWIAFRIDTRPAFQDRLDAKLHSTKLVERAQKKAGGDAVGAVVGGLYIRIVIMQVAIIFGAWFAGAIGSMAPLLLVIVLKTLVDLALGSSVPLMKDMRFSSGNTSVRG